ncbi:protein yellow [Drosophila grimshawi]|uniref:GH18543 n=1 Tax=Drosophila grimshawi TaxID=7222 RepID=B4JI76_DROGR|nr:protein yellow [Drosophila grimshawi]EDV92957.1 GH18543 [Drosophila grimshawi]
MFEHKFIIIIVLTAACCLLQGITRCQRLRLKQLHTLHKWSNLSLGPDPARNTHFLPVDIDIEYGDEGRHRTFLTIPRLSAGAPFTLATISASDNERVQNPRLEAYPNIKWHIASKNCSGITSAIRTYIDECWRLWVVDSGQMNSLQLCAPQILIFDLVKDELVQRSTLPAAMYTPSISIFTAMVVDLAENVAPTKCLGGKAYIADAWGYGLIVFDALSGKSWRIEHESMQPSLGVRRFGSAHAGIFTVSLSPSGSAKRFLYFHTLNSFFEIAIPLQVVNNASIWNRKSKDEAGKHFRIVGTRGTQCESEVMDSEGNLYCSLISLGALISWSELSNYTANDIRAVAYNPQQLKFVTGLKINRNSKGENEIWALSSEPNLFVGGSLKENEIKFQIIGCRTADLLANTPCTVGAMEKHN